MSTDKKNIINKIAAVLRELAPDGRRILYGSVARGDDRDDSDIDVLVILPDDVRSNSFYKRKLEIHGRLADLEIDYGVPISPLVVMKNHWERFKTPFTINVERDGIML